MAEKKATAKKATETKAAAAKKTTTVKKAAAPKAAKISEEETLLGMGWLFKEGKIVEAEAKITLA